jgi:putative oxidoreductase
MFDNFLKTNTHSAFFFIRFIIGLVFFSEGIQKFLFPDALGIGRFIKIGIIYPQFFAPFVGVVEIIFGFLVIIGFMTRLSAIPLLINISVAIITTKIPMFINKGFWHAMHESRVDLCMFLGLITILVLGAGKSSIDHMLTSGNKDSI